VDPVAEALVYGPILIEFDYVIVYIMTTTRMLQKHKLQKWVISFNTTASNTTYIVHR